MSTCDDMRTQYKLSLVNLASSNITLANDVLNILNADPQAPAPLNMNTAQQRVTQIQAPDARIALYQKYVGDSIQNAQYQSSVTFYQQELASAGC